MRTRTIWALSTLFLLALAAPVALADRDEDGDHQGNRVVVINNYGVSPFVYGGYSYVPLKSATDFLGAALLWDSLKHQATVTYNGRKLGLVVGSPTAYYGGRAVALPVAPVMVGGQMLVPVNAFDHYLGVPTRWDERESRVIMRGRPGWGYYQVLPQPPVEAVYGIEHGGPPPWAPAHGWRRKHQALLTTRPLLSSTPESLIYRYATPPPSPGPRCSGTVSKAAPPSPITAARSALR